MKRVLLLGCIWVIMVAVGFAQTTNSASIYEGYSIGKVEFNYLNPKSDQEVMKGYENEIAERFAIHSGMQYGEVLASYYVYRLSLLPFVEKAVLRTSPNTENQVDVIIDITFSDVAHEAQTVNIVKTASLFPVLYNSDRIYLTARLAASEMAYVNHNAWYGQPEAMTTGNPLADSPAGKGGSAWLEGMASAGIYGVARLVPSQNIHLYGGASYLASFTAGNELFTQESSIYGRIEDAFIGVVGGNKTSSGKSYRYNLTYGKKSFTLADGWLLVNTSMNGNYRGALQLNPRWAAKELFTAGGQFDRYTFQLFSVKPNELHLLDSRSTIRGLNLEMNNGKYGTIGLSYLGVPKSNFKYYMPDGAVHAREGLDVYNLRYYRTTGESGRLLLKGELGYQRNSDFDMSAFAYYGEVGWNFKHAKGTPTISYRYAHFPGDDPTSKSYNRWDALYTGGNGEQWVQGSVMYKVVQNSNENTHRFQAICNVGRKWQLVGQYWLFYADNLNNLGGNPALSFLESKFFGQEYNLTVKYFHSRRWYFHLNTAYALPGSAITKSVADTYNWYSLMAFARVSF